MTIRPSRRAAAAVVAVALLVVASQAGADESLKRRTRPGREVLVRGFAEFGADCRLRHVQTLTVVDAPTHGRVEQRPGPVTIGENWVGNKSCAGTQLDGVQVFYVPAADFVGTDSFTFDVEYASHRTVRATVEVLVDAEPGHDVRRP